MKEMNTYQANLYIKEMAKSVGQYKYKEVEDNNKYDRFDLLIRGLEGNGRWIKS